MIVRFNPCMILAGLMVAVTAGAATPAADTVLVVKGDVERPFALNSAAFAALPRERVRAEGHDARESDFEGVLLSELLGRAGVKLGKEMRGDRGALAVVVEGADGYRTVFSIAELDSSYTDRRVLLADRRDGKPIISSEGPLRLVVTKEKRYGRWVRQVVSVSVRKH